MARKISKPQLKLLQRMQVAEIGGGLTIFIGGQDEKMMLKLMAHKPPFATPHAHWNQVYCITDAGRDYLAALDSKAAAPAQPVAAGYSEPAEPGSDAKDECTRELDLYKRFYEFVVGVDGQYPVLDILQGEGVDLLDWAEFHNLLEDIHAMRKNEALADLRNS